METQAIFLKGLVDLKKTNKKPRALPLKKKKQETENREIKLQIKNTITVK